jgi:hypothetical protein
MGTTAFSYYPQNTNDVTFNAWVARFVQALGDCGLTQTADTGQSTFNGSPLVPLPGAIDTSAGYQIWTTPSLAGSPENKLYLKFGFGTQNQTAKPAVFLEVGTGTDGAGTITGPAQDSHRADNFMECYNVSNAGTTGPGPCYFSSGDWGFWFIFGQGGQNSSSDISFGSAAVLRTVDGTGAASNDGYMIFGPHGQSGTTIAVGQENNVAVQYMNPTSLSVHGYLPSGISAGVAGPLAWLGGGDGSVPATNPINTWVDANGDAAIFPIFCTAPHPAPTAAAVGWQSDIPTFTTFSATPVGTTQRRYVSIAPLMLTTQTPTALDETYSGSVRYALPWE